MQSTALAGGECTQSDERHLFCCAVRTVLRRASSARARVLEAKIRLTRHAFSGLRARLESTATCGEQLSSMAREMEELKGTVDTLQLGHEELDK